MGCCAERRENVNFPEGYYFRLRLERVEVVVQIADDTAHPDTDFSSGLAKAMTRAHNTYLSESPIIYGAKGMRYYWIPIRATIKLTHYPRLKELAQ